jgi:hypothetical protein
MAADERITERLLLPLRTADARIAAGRIPEGRDATAPNSLERSRHFSCFQRSRRVELWRCLLNSEKASFRPYMRVRSFDDLDPDLAIYRQRTIQFLRRYFKMSMEVGRVPSLLGREVFRARVTSYRMGTFEDTVIFVHDIERCLERLDPESQSLIVRIVFQDYTQEEAAAIFGCTLRTLTRRFPEAIHQEPGKALATGKPEHGARRDRCMQRRRVPVADIRLVPLCQRGSLASCLPHSWPIRQAWGVFVFSALESPHDIFLVKRRFSRFSP